MIDRFLREKESASRSPVTIENYKYTFDRFDPLNASPSDIQDFLINAPSPATAGLHFRHLRSFYNWAEKRGLIFKSPMKYLDPPREIPPIVQPYSDSEIKRMLAVSRNRDRLLITLLDSTGIRRGEAARLTRDDVQAETILVHGKGRRRRYVPLSDSVRELIGRRDPVVGLTPHGIFEAVRRIGVRSGVHAWPHRFRDTFAVRYLEKGGGIDNLQTLLGHSNIQTTLRYIQWGRQERALAEARRLMA